MDWIAKLEQEERAKTEAEKRSGELLGKQFDARKRFWEETVPRLLPLLKKEIDDVAKRLGIELPLGLGSEITVEAPELGSRSERYSPFPYCFIISESDGDSVRVQVEDDHTFQRSANDVIPDEMSVAEYYGTVQTILDIRVSIDDLEAGGLKLLVEWLVRSSREGRAAAAPNLREKRKSKRVGLCLAFAIVSIYFQFTGPIAIIWGLSIRRSLVAAGQNEGRKALSWAIGLGWFSSVALILSIIYYVMLHLRR